MRGYGIILVFLLTLNSPAQAPSKPPLEFPVACSAAAHTPFVQGVIKLHNSAYDEAAAYFRNVEQLDPKCVMAVWGEAMSFNHPFWGEQDIAGGRKALAKLGPTRTARLAKATTARERGYLEAVEILYGDGDKDARDFAYSAAMQKLALQNPSDYEASAFYAAAILGTIRLTDPDNSKRTTAAAILKAVLAKYPDHPGGLHYLIHSYDLPEFAQLGLDAAKRYEKVADQNFHALHMPSHIYVQLGMWADVARCNEAAYEASDRYVRSSKLSVARRDYHSLDWLQYAEIQLGQYRKAKSRIEQMLQAAREAGVAGMNGVAAEFAARFAVETADWSALAPFPQVSRSSKLLFAFGLEAARRGELGAAARYVGALDEVIQQYRSAGEHVRPAQADIFKRELQAEIAVRDKRPADATRLASEAVAIESQLNVPSILEQGGFLKPTTEFYGEILLEQNKPAEAAIQFTATLKRTPRRTQSLLGLARARARQGDKPGAVKAYQELAAIWSGADPDLPLLNEVKSYLQNQKGQ